MKKITVFLLAFLLVLPFVSSANMSEWAKPEIEEAKVFLPDEVLTIQNFTENITREEFCIITALMLQKKGVKKQILDSPFEDSNNDDISFLYSLGIINGISATEFAPHNSLTRQEAATILSRIASYFKLLHTELFFDFEDYDSISDWAVSAINVVCNMHIMKGIGGNKFDPLGAYTKEQAIATISRLYKIISEIQTGETFLNGTFAEKMNALMPSDKNYMFSPISIKMALSIAANGATGETQSQILKALDINKLQEFNENSKDIIKRYSQTDAIHLDFANSLWLNLSRTKNNFLDAYKGLVSNYYNGTYDTVTNDDAVNTINNWVSDKTNEKIKSIIDNNEFEALIINAIYFKGAWAKEFSIGDDHDFTDRNGKTSKTEFMYKTDYYQYAEKDGYKTLKIPYINRAEELNENGLITKSEHFENLSTSMYIILGDNTPDNPETIINGADFKQSYIHISMPTFKIEYSESIKGMLGKLGIETAFSGNADFSSMYQYGEMKFTDVIHKTYIKVDEIGTEAAAVTAISMKATSMPNNPIPIEFIADKPFTFVISDDISHEILFMGEYAYKE